MTCRDCANFQRRGGIVLPAEDTCVAFEDQGVSAAVAAVLARTAAFLARSGECPLFSPLEAPADSYRSEDLPPRVFPRPGPPESAC